MGAMQRVPGWSCPEHRALPLRCRPEVDPGRDANAICRQWLSGIRGGEPERSVARRLHALQPFARRTPARRMWRRNRFALLSTLDGQFDAPQSESNNGTTLRGHAMDKTFRTDYVDLNTFRGLGEDPCYRLPRLVDRPRAWPLDRWAEAPRDLGYSDFSSVQWKGMRLLKDPATQSAYHNLLWELRPRTILELGVYSGASLVWFRDITRMMGIDCHVIGVDRHLDRCRIPASEMAGISLHEGDCSNLSSLDHLPTLVSGPLLVIDDAHCNTFNVMSWAVAKLLAPGDYFIIEDMIPYWERYSPDLLADYLASFHGVLEMDMIYANTCPQLERGVFRRSTGGK
jgi:cephamycin C biosynthesis protein